MVILVTRPEPGATRTAEHLRALHYMPFILPLSKTKALPVDSREICGDVVVVTSEAPFLYLKPDLLKILHSKPLYVVGKHTAEAARNAGFTNICFVAPTALKLCSMIDCSKKTRFLYLAGHVRRPDLETQMTKKFEYFRIIEVYDTQEIRVSEQQKQKIPQKIEAVMLYSALAAAGLDQISGYIHHSTVLLCLSARIANAIPKTFPNVPVIAYEPNEDAMLEGLKTVLS